MEAPPTKPPSFCRPAEPGLDGSFLECPGRVGGAAWWHQWRLTCNLGRRPCWGPQLSPEPRTERPPGRCQLQRIHTGPLSGVNILVAYKTLPSGSHIPVKVFQNLSLPHVHQQKSVAQGRRGRHRLWGGRTTSASGPRHRANPQWEVSCRGCSEWPLF